MLESSLPHFAAIIIRAVWIEDEETIMAQLHAGQGEILHQVALPHAGGGEDADVIGHGPAGETDGNVKNPIAGAKSTDLHVPKILLQEIIVLSGRPTDPGEMSGDGLGFTEDFVLD